MELRNIRAFLAVADERHFGRAAVSLNLTQPALTLRIQVLERELGIQLLQRNARKVRLTDAGEALLEHARTLVQEEDRTVREMQDYVAGLAGRLRISYLTLWDAGLPARIIAEFRRRYPSITMKNVPVMCLRGERMVSTSAGVNAPLVAATIGWVAKGTGEPPNIIREEPPDQMGAALAQSGDAFALMTEHRAILAAADGLIYRRLTPTPVIEYGVAYLHENQALPLANLVKTVEDIAPPLQSDLPADSELLGVGPARDGEIPNRTGRQSLP